MGTKITDEISFQYIPSPGPGGQNVNKVATTAVLRFDIVHSVLLSGSQRNRLISLAGKKIDKEGILTITARRYRSQERNRKDALARLEELIHRASLIPRRRYPTIPNRSANQRRLEAKNYGAIRK